MALLIYVVRSFLTGTGAQQGGRAVWPSGLCILRTRNMGTRHCHLIWVLKAGPRYGLEALHQLSHLSLPRPFLLGITKFPAPFFSSLTLQIVTKYCHVPALSRQLACSYRVPSSCKHESRPFREGLQSKGAGSKTAGGYCWIQTEWQLLSEMLGREPFHISGFILFWRICIDFTGQTFKFSE